MNHLTTLVKVPASLQESIKTHPAYKADYVEKEGSVYIKTDSRSVRAIEKHLQKIVNERTKSLVTKVDTASYYSSLKSTRYKRRTK